MVRWLLAFVVPLLLACAQDDVRPRGVAVVSATRHPKAETPFTTQESAALFVGVRDFAEGSNLGEIRYTVDDAVDLAYTMVFDKKVRLVPASRVALALSNDPVKTESREKLTRLIQAGAIRTDATREIVAAQLERQAARAGDDGLFILFVASHGFSSEGVNYVLSSTSRFQDEASSLSLSKFFDVAATRPRSLIFIDACRDRVPAGRRGPSYRAGGVAPLIERMTPIVGQVIFYAAAAGGIAHESNGNGVFTRAIIDSLTACDAGKNKGFITAETLGRRIDEQVRKWVKRHRRVSVRKATQMVMDVETKDMPIADCGPEPQPAEIKRADGSTFTVHGVDGTELWSGQVGGRVTVSKIVDLHDDGSREVVIGDATGAITVFGADGEALWSQKTAAPIEKLTIDYLEGMKKMRHIVALSHGGGKSLVSIFTSDGTPYGQFAHDDRLIDVLIDKETARRAAKIITADAGTVMMLDGDGKQRWSSMLGQTIESLATIDIDNNRFVDIEVRMTEGKKYLTFAGTTLKIDPK